MKTFLKKLCFLLLLTNCSQNQCPQFKLTENQVLLIGGEISADEYRKLEESEEEIKRMRRL